MADEDTSVAFIIFGVVVAIFLVFFFIVLFFGFSSEDTPTIGLGKTASDSRDSDDEPIYREPVSDSHYVSDSEDDDDAPLSEEWIKNRYNQNGVDREKEDQSTWYLNTKIE